MNNKEIRNLMKQKKVPMWQIADALSVSEMTVSRMFRHKLSEKEENLIKSVIDEIIKEREEA